MCEHKFKSLKYPIESHQDLFLEHNTTLRFSHFILLEHISKFLTFTYIENNKSILIVLGVL